MYARPPVVILAAGRGERLCEGEKKPPKPLISVLGLTLLERVILSCKGAGIEEFFIVLGYREAEIELRFLEWGKKYKVSITTVKNQDWKNGNGTSALACSPFLSSAFLLVMCDHLFDPQVIAQLIAEGKDGEACYVVVDRRTEQVFDIEDATRVQVQDGRISAIGKGLEAYNAVDTGIFLCWPFLFDALRQAQLEGDGTLSGGIRRLAKQKRMKAVDLGEHLWLDVDTPKALKRARRLLMKRLVKTDEDGFISQWFNRPLSVRFSAQLVTHCPLEQVTPNMISLASFFLILLGAFLFVFGGYAVSLAAGILCQIGSITDGCDGEVARLTFRTSRFGAWLDTLFDRYGGAAIVTGVSYGFWRFHPTPWVWLGGIFALTGFLLASYTKKEYAIRYGEGFPNKGVWAKLIKRDLRIFMVLLGAILGYPYFFLLAIGAVSHLGIGRLFWQVYKGRQTVTR